MKLVSFSVCSNQLASCSWISFRQWWIRWLHDVLGGWVSSLLIIPYCVACDILYMYFQFLSIWFTTVDNLDEWDFEEPLIRTFCCNMMIYSTKMRSEKNNVILKFRGQNTHDSALRWEVENNNVIFVKHSWFNNRLGRKKLVNKDCGYFWWVPM